MTKEKIVKSGVKLTPSEALKEIVEKLGKLSHRIGVSKITETGNDDHCLYFKVETRLGRVIGFKVYFMPENMARMLTEKPEEMGPEDLVVSRIEEIIEETLNNNEAL